MVVYYKFMSARDYDSISMDGPFLSVGTLKEKIFESKHLGRGTDFDLVVTNAQTNEEYLDEGMLIPKNTSVLIRRVPGRPRMPIVTAQHPKVEAVVETQPEKSNLMVAHSFAVKSTEEFEWDEFGNDLYSIPEVLPVHTSNIPADAPPTSKADEDSKIRALIETPALDWQRQGADGFGSGRGFGRGMGGRGLGRLGLERKTPPQGYVCHRCKVPGHFIQHCPTNGDPNYDIKRVKPPTGIPKSMLQTTADGSYALPSGAVAVLKPNEDAFEREIQGLPSTRPVADLPPEFHCQMCKEVMKDAVLASKCCLNSFCDKCIRDYIISNSKCVCGKTNVLADDLLPNRTLRDTINRILESGNCSTENAGSFFQVQDRESTLPIPKIPSPTMSAASKEEQKLDPVTEETLNPIVNRAVDEAKPVISPPQVSVKPKTSKVVDASEATFESMSLKEPASQGKASLVEEELQQKLASGVAVKKKKKTVHMPSNDLRRPSQDITAESYIMPPGPTAYNPYWTGVQPGMEGYMAPYGGHMPFMAYGLGPFDVPFPGAMPPDPFVAQGCMMPVMPPQRDLAHFGMGMRSGPPVMSREEFEARKAAELRRRRENERQSEWEPSREREFGREVSSGGDASSMKSKPHSSGGDPHHRHRLKRASPGCSSSILEAPLPRPSKRKSEQHHDHHHHRFRDSHEQDRHHRHQHQHRSKSFTKPLSETKDKAISTTAANSDRISILEGEAISKKRKHFSSSEPAAAAPADGPCATSSLKKFGSSAANGFYDEHKSSSAKVASLAYVRKSASASALDKESSDDGRDFKRKPSRYERSPPLPAGWEEDVKHSRGSRERERKQR